MSSFQISIRRACRLASFNRATRYYRSRAKDKTALRIRLRDPAASRVGYGYRRLHILLQREGRPINHKRVYRIYQQEGLSIRLKRRKKRVAAVRVVGPMPTTPNECWSMDFVADRLADGKRFRALTLVDNFSRVSPAIEVDFSISGKRVVEVLEQAVKVYGKPSVIKVDNGPEFISGALDQLAHRNGVKLDFSRPGKPTDNAYIESFNGRFREECLARSWFSLLQEARSQIEWWRMDYNNYRPHSALGNLSPIAFMQKRRLNSDRIKQIS